jgi:hypothetical protein
MENVRSDRQTKRLDQDPAFTLEQIIDSLETLKRETDHIFKNPPDAKMDN